MLAGNVLVIEEVVIDGFTQHGISLENTTGSTNVSVDSSGIRSNAGNGINSFIIGGNVTLSVSNCRFISNAIGVNLSNGTNATIFQSVLSGNATGVQAFKATLAVSDSNISNNTTGLTVSTGGTIRISGNQITNNGTGLSVTGGSLVSFSSNVLKGNTTDGVPTSTVALQ